MVVKTYYTRFRSKTNPATLEVSEEKQVFGGKVRVVHKDKMLNVILTTSHPKVPSVLEGHFKYRGLHMPDDIEILDFELLQ